MKNIYLGIIAAFALLLLGSAYAAYSITTPEVSNTTSITSCNTSNSTCTLNHSCCSSGCNKSECIGQCDSESKCGCSK